MNRNKIINGIKEVARIVILAIGLLLSMPLHLLSMPLYLCLVAFRWLDNGVYRLIQWLLKVLKDTTVNTEENDTDRENNPA